MVSLTNHKPQRRSDLSSRNNSVHNSEEQLLVRDDGVAIQGQIGRQSFGLVLQESGSKSRHKSRSSHRSNIAQSISHSQEALNKRQSIKPAPMSKNVQIKASGRVIDLERVKREALENAEIRAKNRKKRLEELQILYMQYPSDK